MIDGQAKCITVANLKAALDELSDDLIITPNIVGNLAVFKRCGDSDSSCIGYIDLYNERYVTYQVGEGC